MHSSSLAGRLIRAWRQQHGRQSRRAACRRCLLEALAWYISTPATAPSAARVMACRGLCQGGMPHEQEGDREKGGGGNGDAAPGPLIVRAKAMKFCAPHLGVNTAVDDLQRARDGPAPLVRLHGRGARTGGGHR
ncbi:hypothetical protein ABPG77_002801 [Micractinium sp. CCAP 211/92]